MTGLPVRPRHADSALRAEVPAVTGTEPSPARGRPVREDLGELSQSVSPR